MKVQLLSEISDYLLDKYLQSESFALSQKLDGRRAMVIRTGTDTKCFGRSGLEAELPKVIKTDFNKVKSDWIFDGEIIGDTYYVFDVLSYPGGSIIDRPWIERNTLLKTVLQNFSDHVKIVEQHLSVRDKLAHYEDCVLAGAEGVVFCNVESTYKSGRRSSQCLKYKFVKTIDCVVIGKSVNDKDNLVLGLYDDNGRIIDVGKISAITGSGKNYEFKIGDVVTVKYLYATKSHRLYQPVFPTLKEDKEARECLLSQMIMKSEVIL